MIAQGLTLPMHLGSIPTALAACIRYYDNEMRPGDIYILNDPFDGGMHLPDISCSSRSTSRNNGSLSQQQSVTTLTLAGASQDPMHPIQPECYQEGFVSRR